ncbi:hypothetical protein [Chelativorans sp.]|uniref:hypothetical protein n=1 Tax=Chelativorans sp. TaxID=2203393 RepID=UPI00281284ED|nr:hypothetical protein [Chelativorans sp.]
MAKLEEMRRPEQGTKAFPMLLYLSAGPLLWAGHLTFVYMAHTAICALAGSPAAATAVLLVATGLFLLPLGFLLFKQFRLARLLGLGEAIEDRSIYDGIALFANVLSFVGIAWSGLAVAMLSSCVLGR